MQNCKYVLERGVGGVPDLFYYYWNPNIFVSQAHAKFRKPTTTPYGVLNNGGESKKKKINTKNSDLPKFAPLVARTSLRPI